MIRLHKLDLNPLEKQSFRLHTIYTLLEGVNPWCASFKRICVSEKFEGLKPAIGSIVSIFDRGFCFPFVY